MRKWYPALLVAVTMIAAAIVYPRLPDRVPTHWNFRGEVDGYGPKWVSTWLIPVVILGLWGLLRLLPTIDPRRANYAKMEGTYELLVNVALTILAAIQFTLLAATLGMTSAVPRLLPAIFGVALIVLGNALPRARPNWWFGIRTPWTLSNDRVWERTHRVGGYLIAVAGLLIVGASLLPLAFTGAIIGAVVGVAAVASVVYSYVVWRQEPSR